VSFDAGGLGRGKGIQPDPIGGGISSATVSSSECVAQRVSSETCDVCGCEPASAVTRTKSEALWRTPIFCGFLNGRMY
jgi:hypothetical protein